MEVGIHSEADFPMPDVTVDTCRPRLALTYWNMSPPSTNSMAIARYSGVRNACVGQ